MAELRPMRAEDVPAVEELTHATFEDLSRRRGEPLEPREDPEPAYVRLRHLLATDPGGCWVADGGDGAPAGVAIAILREGIWGLSLLAVRPGGQSRGLGRALLDRTLAYGDGARGGIIISSPDPRALRVYARAGFELHPAVLAAGTPRDVRAAPAVRPFADGDHAMAAAVDRALRGGAHGADLDALAAAGCERLVLPDRGYAVHRNGEVKALAATDEEAAAALLRTVLARTPAGARAAVEAITSAQQWAVEVVVAAGLELRFGGAVFLRGDTGAFQPYLPGGAYL